MQRLCHRGGSPSTPGTRVSTSLRHKSSVSCQQPRFPPHFPKEKACMGRCMLNHWMDDIRKKLPRDLKFYFCNCFCRYHLEMIALCCEGGSGWSLSVPVNWVIPRHCPFSSARHKWGHLRLNSNERMWALRAHSSPRDCVSHTTRLQPVRGDFVKSRSSKTRISISMSAQQCVHLRTLTGKWCVQGEGLLGFWEGTRHAFKIVP